MRLLMLLILSGLFCSPVSAEDHLRLATTTSTENSGLLGVLLPPFEAEAGCKVDVVAVGTGKALKLGETGDVDIVLVHARAMEDAFVEAGHGVGRRDVMANDFVIVGPADDPAGIRGMTDAAAAVKKIFSAKAFFVSRGDQSGTHVKELQLWSEADLAPAGDWYLESGRGMGEVLTMADERQGYALADRGTYIAHRKNTELKVVVEGGKRLHNPYGVIIVNPARHPHVQFQLASRFVDYLTSGEAREIINAYKMSGDQLFFAMD